MSASPVVDSVSKRRTFGRRLSRRTINRHLKRVRRRKRVADIAERRLRAAYDALVEAEAQ